MDVEHPFFGQRQAADIKKKNMSDRKSAAQKVWRTGVLADYIGDFDPCGPQELSTLTPDRLKRLKQRVINNIFSNAIDHVKAERLRLHAQYGAPAGEPPPAEVEAPPLIFETVLKGFGGVQPASRAMMSKFFQDNYSLKELCKLAIAASEGGYY